MIVLTAAHADTKVFGRQFVIFVHRNSAFQHSPGFFDAASLV
jgi:hypothetical protein